MPSIQLSIQLQQHTVLSKHSTPTIHTDKIQPTERKLALSDKVTLPPVNAWSCSWNVELTEKRDLVQQLTECCHKRDGERRWMGRCQTVQLVDHQEPRCQCHPPTRPPHGQEQKSVPPKRLIKSVLTSNAQSTMKDYEVIHRSRNLVPPERLIESVLMSNTQSTMKVYRVIK